MRIRRFALVTSFSSLATLLGFVGACALAACDTAVTFPPPPLDGSADAKPDAPAARGDGGLDAEAVSDADATSADSPASGDAAPASGDDASDDAAEGGATGDASDAAGD